ncbi:MAG TPA: response regulator [Capsulimonadaceae bacterium]|nr:response regulator [Capsulimonadaceae bacterium]
MTQETVEILLVEDDDNDLKLALHALRGEKLANRIAVARDGEEALDFIFCRGEYIARSPNQPPRLVMLDLKLPKVDGLQVLREIKASPATQAIPVVVLTSSREEKDMVESYQLGVNSYIQKPVDFDQFREAIRILGLYWMVVNQPPPDQAFSGPKPKG